MAFDFFEHNRHLANMHIGDLLYSAKCYIDQNFGNGYAKENPVLVAAYLTAVAAMTGHYLEHLRFTTIEKAKAKTTDAGTAHGE